MTTVRTKDELKAAKEMGAAEIIVVGELAQKIKKAEKITLLGKASIAAITVVLGAAMIAVPFTSGSSLLVAAPTAAVTASFFAVAPAAAAVLTGADITAIIAVSAVGLALVLAVLKDYEEISYESGRLVLKKKRNKGPE